MIRWISDGQFDAFHSVVNVYERTSLIAFAMNRERVPDCRLDKESI